MPRRGGQKVLLDILPFMFICAPSGCGKTTFAWNLQKTVPSPMIYWLFADLGSNPQEKYKPFGAVSDAIEVAIKDDLSNWRRIWDIRPGIKNVTIAKLGTTSNMSVELSSVNLIVALYENLARLRRDDPSLTWAEAQFQIQYIPKGKMSLKDGKVRLKKLVNNGFPLTTFIDEASAYERIVLVYTRSLFRNT